MKERLAAWSAGGAAAVVGVAMCITAYAYIARTPGTAPPLWLDVATFAGLAAFAIVTPILALPALLLRRGPGWSRWLAVGVVALWAVVLVLALLLPFLL